MKFEFFQPHLPVTDIITIAAISFSFSMSALAAPVTHQDQGLLLK